MAATYTVFFNIHVACVVFTGTGFALRGVWMMQGSQMLARRWVRVLPHIVDTVLLASAFALAVLSAQYPLVQDWLTAKLMGLIAYIVLGMIALKPARGRAARIAAFCGAVLVFGYIVAVAITKSAVPFGN